jgi:hypothetical protein
VALGAILTGGFALLNSWVMRNRDLNLKLWERFLDRRITAHETVVGLALKMRFMCPLGPVHGGEVVRAPQVMLSKEAFDEWLAEFSQSSVPATTWLSTSVKRELNFVQDYLVTVHTNLAGASSEQFPIVGAFIRQDFIDFSSSLKAGIPKALFDARFPTYVFTHPGYDVSADGQRFLINTIVGEEKQPITVKVNWQAGTKR